MIYFEIDSSEDERPWFTLPRRFATLEEATTVGSQMIFIYLPNCQSFAIRYRKITEP